MSGKQTTRPAAKVRSERKQPSPVSEAVPISNPKPTPEEVEQQVRDTSDPLAARAQQYAAMSAARGKFVSASVGLGWRMAIAVILPIFVGVQVDKHFDTAPSYTLTAIFFGITAAGVITYKTVKAVTKEEEAEFDREAAEAKPVPTSKKEANHA